MFQTYLIGPINVPIECTCKKAIVKVHEQVIDFKKVIFGESLKREIKFINEGALNTDIIFKNNKGIALGKLYDVASTRTGSVARGKSLAEVEFEPDEEENKLMSQLKFTKQSIIDGYQTINVPIEYWPT